MWVFLRPSHTNTAFESGWGLTVVSFLYHFVVLLVTTPRLFLLHDQIHQSFTLCQLTFDFRIWQLNTKYDFLWGKIDGQQITWNWAYIHLSLMKDDYCFLVDKPLKMSKQRKMQTGKQFSKRISPILFKSGTSIVNGSDVGYRRKNKNKPG